MAAFLSALGAVGEFLKLLGQAMGFWHDAQEQQTGVELQAGADAKAALAVENRIAVIAATPVGDAQVDAALSPNGVF